MSSQYGMPPSVRRNLSIVMSVIDLLESLRSSGLAFGLQLIQSSYPVQLGLVLLVSQADVQECARWMKEQSNLADDVSLAEKA